MGCCRWTAVCVFGVHFSLSTYLCDFKRHIHQSHIEVGHLGKAHRHGPFTTAENCGGERELGVAKADRLENNTEQKVGLVHPSQGAAVAASQVVVSCSNDEGGNQPSFSFISLSLWHLGARA
ncbi:hypothetical protein B0T17DRAFT_52247 [Bombardia bombarda]|uniref:Secreted protein n=1 Tax=Bombardia bombarda TaxID=252184 RepID=A0AA39XKG1_9PEZI|nr:hypothetical protein B0T17DRAFT_52247 [Bombardia bombarda]